MTSQNLPDIPLPPGATSGDDWALMPEGPDAGLYYRCVDWGDTWANEMVVGITGVQFSDGRVERHLALNFDDIHGKEQAADISADTARGLTTLLIAAVNRLDLGTGTAWSGTGSQSLTRLIQELNAATESFGGVTR